MSLALRVVLYTDSPVIGGGENIARQLMASLGSRFEPVVVGTRRDVVYHIASGRPGMEARVLPPVRGRGDLFSLYEHVKALRELHPDVVHVNQHLWSGQYGVLASFLAGAPCLCAVHGVLPASSTSQRCLTIGTARLARHFVGVSHSVSAAIREELRPPGRRVTTIYNGIPLETPHAVESEVAAMPGTILGVGRLAREKGFDLLVEAMTSLPGHRLLLVGDGPERARLEALASSLGVEDRVEFAGWVSEPWVSRFRPDALAVPSRFEAMSLVVLEAMRAGVPLVATRVGGIPELVVDQVTGVLVDPESPLGLAKALGELLDDPRRRDEMAVAGSQRLVEHFGDEKMVASYEALYAQLARRRRAPTPRRLGRRARRDGHTCGVGASGAPRSAGTTAATALDHRESGPFGPTPTGRGDWLRGFVQVLPPEVRARLRDNGRAGARMVKGVSKALASPLARRRSDDDSASRQVVSRNAGALRGRVLVLGGPKLCELVRASSRAIEECVVWDLEPRNLQASLMVELGEDGALGTGEYDCEVAVATSWQPGANEVAIANLWLALRPGGSLLLAVPARRADQTHALTEDGLRRALGSRSLVARVETGMVGGNGKWLIARVERAGEETM